MGDAIASGWEYLDVPETHRDQLAALGREGWELVAIGGQLGEQRLYLKRPMVSLRHRATLEQRARYYTSLGRDPESAPGGPAA